MKPKPCELRDKYTILKPCCVAGVPDAHTVWIQVGVQSFCLDGYHTKAEAEWMRLMVGKALENIIKKEKEGV